MSATRAPSTDAGPNADRTSSSTIYLSWPDAPTDGDQCTAELAQLLPSTQAPSSWPAMRRWWAANCTVVRAAPMMAWRGPDDRDMHSPGNGSIPRMKNFDVLAAAPPSKGLGPFPCDGRATTRPMNGRSRWPRFAERPAPNEAGRRIRPLNALWRRVWTALAGADQRQGRLDDNRIASARPGARYPATGGTALVRRTAPRLSGQVEEITELAATCMTTNHRQAWRVVFVSRTRRLGVAANVTGPRPSRWPPSTRYAQKVQRSRLAVLVYRMS